MTIEWFPQWNTIFSVLQRGNTYVFLGGYFFFLFFLISFDLFTGFSFLSFRITNLYRYPQKT